MKKICTLQNRVEKNISGLCILIRQKRMKKNNQKNMYLTKSSRKKISIVKNYEKSTTFADQVYYDD